MRMISSLLLLLAAALLAPDSYAQFKRIVRGNGGDLVLDRADSLFLKADYEAAIEALENRLKDNPYDGVTHYNHGLLERMTGRGNGLQQFRRAGELLGDTYYVEYSIGRVLTEEGRLEEGEGHLRRATRLIKYYYEADTELGRNLRLQGKPREAERAIRRAFAHNRTYVHAYTELASIQRDLGEEEKALEALREGYAKFPYEQILIELVRRFLAAGQADSVALYGEEYLLYYPKGDNLGEVLEALSVARPDTEYEPDGTYADLIYPPDRPRRDPAEVLPVGLRLVYNVRWSFIKLGTLVVDILEGEYKGEPTWRMQAIAITSPGLPFITIQDTFRIHLDRELRHTKYIEMFFHEKDYVALKTFETDFESGKGYFRSIMGDGHWLYHELPLPPNAIDANSQLWLAQQFVLLGINGTVNTEISGGFERTIINNHGLDKVMKYGEYEARTIRLDGIMRYTGIAGLTGEYEGWYSYDERTWPIKAKFKIFLGSVVIRYRSHGPTPEPPGPAWGGRE